MIELGLYTFADVSRDPKTGVALAPDVRMRHLIEEIELADQVGLDVFGVGEHHRPDYSVSAPAVVLAAAAVRTTRIRLTSAVTVLSSDDPVRVFQQFATVDLLSGGRAEIMAGRGSFIESYPLFGQDLRDYDALFAEKLELLLRLRDSERITWSGVHRPSIEDRGVYPRPVQDRLPVWIAVGGTPASAVRAGTLGLPMALAIIGGVPDRFAPFAELYRNAGARAGHDPSRLPLGINSLGLRRRHLAARGRHVLPVLRRGHEHGGEGARLVADWPGRLRRHARAAGGAAGGQPAGSGRQDPARARDLREPAVPAADEHRRDAARGTCCGRSSCSGPRWRLRFGRPRPIAGPVSAPA